MLHRYGRTVWDFSWRKTYNRKMDNCASARDPLFRISKRTGTGYQVPVLRKFSNCLRKHHATYQLEFVRQHLYRYLIGDRFIRVSISDEAEIVPIFMCLGLACVHDNCYYRSYRPFSHDEVYNRIGIFMCKSNIFARYWLIVSTGLLMYCYCYDEVQ